MSTVLKSVRLNSESLAEAEYIIKKRNEILGTKNTLSDFLNASLLPGALATCAHLKRLATQSEYIIKNKKSFDRVVLTKEQIKEINHLCDEIEKKLGFPVINFELLNGGL